MRSLGLWVSAIAERVKQIPSFHWIDLGSGIVTLGAKSPEIGWRERQ